MLIHTLHYDYPYSLSECKKKPVLNALLNYVLHFILLFIYGITLWNERAMLMYL